MACNFAQTILAEGSRWTIIDFFTLWLNVMIWNVVRVPKNALLHEKMCFYIKNNVTRLFARYCLNIKIFFGRMYYCSQSWVLIRSLKCLNTVGNKKNLCLSVYWVHHLTFLFYQLVLTSWVVMFSSCLIWQTISFIRPLEVNFCKRIIFIDEAYFDVWHKVY